MKCPGCSKATDKIVMKSGHCCAHYLRSKGLNPLAAEYKKFVIKRGRFQESSTATAHAAAAKTPEECKQYLLARSSEF